jgi:hypothetical protein
LEARKQRNSGDARNFKKFRSGRKSLIKFT